MDTRTNHSADVRMLRKVADMGREIKDRATATNFDLAADLLEMHDATGISLDNWPSARTFVERLIDHPITENGAVPGGEVDE